MVLKILLQGIVVSTSDRGNTESKSQKKFNFQELSDSDLLELNKQGLIPAPGESVKDFYARAEANFELRSFLSSIDYEILPFRTESDGSREILENTFHLTAALFDIRLDWIPLFFSNYKLAPWHGGCAWIFQSEEDGPRMAFLQLRKAFAKSERYLFLYNREELIAHECAHAGRMAFDEPRYEEILAYRTDRSSRRAWLGPIVNSGTESFIFIALLFMIVLLDFYLLVTGNFDTYLSLNALKLLPIGLFILAFVRLWRKRRIFNRTLRNLQSILDENSANHVIYRLSDHEIDLFSELPNRSILAYARSERLESLRWHVLWSAYFPNGSNEKDTGTWQEESI